MENGTAESQEVIAERRNVLSLKRCRELALANNKQLAISKLTAQIAEDTHKAAKTKYLHVLLVWQDTSICARNIASER